MTSTSTDFPVVVRGLSKTYRVGFWLNRQVRALTSLDFDVPRGTIFGLLGPNGAGKSTTIKILLDLVRATAGTAQIFGKSPASRDSRQDLGFLPENPAPYSYLTAEEFLTLSGSMAGLSGAALDKRVTELLGEVDMTHARKLQIRRFSKGMVQRLALSQSLITNPKLLILDEPTSGLDPIGRRQIRDLIIAQRDRGTTVLLSTHIIPDVEAVCDRIVILVGGKKLREGNVRELLAAQDNQIEIVFEGIEPEKLTVPLRGTQRLERRTAVRLDEKDSGAALEQLVQHKAKVLQITPVRHGIEELFLSAVKEAGRTVGSEVAS